MEDEAEHQFEDDNDNEALEAYDADEIDDDNGPSEEQIDAEDLHFQDNVKPHILGTIQHLTSFTLFKDDDGLSFEENTEVYSMKRNNCIQSLIDLQTLVKEDVSKRERRVWTLLIETGIHTNELFTLLSNFKTDFEIVTEVVDLLILLSESPDQNNPRFRKFQARGGAEERKRATFYFGKQIKLLQRLKQGILEHSYIQLIVWSLMKKEQEKELEEKQRTNEKQRRQVSDGEVYLCSIYKLFNNLLSIPDAKPQKVLQTEELQTRMQDVMIKQLQTDTLFLDYTVNVIARYVEKRDDVSSHTTMKWLVQFYLLLLKFTTMICWNETAQDICNSGIRPTTTTDESDIVMSQNEENMVIDNGELKRLLRREKLYKDQVKSMILTSRHSRFQGTLLERQSNVSKIIENNKKQFADNTDTEEESEQGANKKKESIQKTFVVSNYSQMNTASMYSASDNPFLVGGGAQKASAVTGKRLGARRYNVVSDKMELTFSSSSLDTKKIIKTFVDNLYRSCFNSFIQLALEAIWKQQDESIAISNTLDQKSTKESLDHESERNLLFMGQFMLSYNRHKYLQKKNRELKEFADPVTFDISHISNLLKDRVIMMIFQKLLTDYFIMQHNLNLSFVVALLREIFTTFRWMTDREYSGSNSLTWGRIVSIHLHHILYDPTNTEAIVRLIREFKPYLNSTKYLSQLVLFTDLFITVINENLSIEAFFTKKKGDDETMEEGEDNENQEDISSASQKRFELESFKRKFANASMIKQYMYLFRFYDINTPEVNQSIIKMFKYVIEDLEMEIMLFRASFLKLCFNILCNKNFLTETSSPLEKQVNQEVVDFCLTVVRNFFKLVNDDPFTICESLHWSTMGMASMLSAISDINPSKSKANSDSSLNGFIDYDSGEEDAVLGIDQEQSDDGEVKETEEEEESRKQKKPRKKRESKPKKKSKRKKKEEEQQPEEEEQHTPPKKKKKKKEATPEQEEEEVVEEEIVEVIEEEKLNLSSDSEDESSNKLRRLSKKRVSFAPTSPMDDE